jgi:hypothetical protein
MVTRGVPPSFRKKDPALLEVESDRLEPRLIEGCILEMQAVICVQHRFCSQCQQMLDTWLALEALTRYLPHIIRQYTTISMEAAARNGCNLCACVLQSLRDSKVLDLYRRIETRLEILQALGVCSLSICPWGNKHALMVMLPGPEYPREFVSGIDVDIQGRITAMDSDCGMQMDV